MAAQVLGRPADDFIKQAQAFLAKAEGKDKLLATLQYAAMFVAAGAAGNALQIQKSVSASRKPFRILKPVESLLPLATPPAKLTPLALMGQAKALSMAVFFAFDHVVWAGAAGLVTDKARVERAQKISFYGWLCGSVLQLMQEAHELNRLVKVAAARPAEGAPDAEASKKADAAQAAIRTRAISAATVGTQALVAASLLQLIPLKPRAIGALGVVTSALACYQLLPPLPPAPKPKVA